MDMMVNMLAGNDWGDGVGMLRVRLSALIYELARNLGELGLDVALITMRKFSLLDGDDVVPVILWEHLPVLHGLNRGVIVILMDLFIDGGLDILVSCWVYCLMRDAWGHLLVDSCVMFARTGP